MHNHFIILTIHSQLHIPNISNWPKIKITGKLEVGLKINSIFSSVRLDIQLLAGLYK